MTTTRTANLISNYRQLLAANPGNVWAANQLLKSTKSLKRQKQKAIGTQTKINLS